MLVRILLLTLSAGCGAGDSDPTTREERKVDAAPIQSAEPASGPKGVSSQDLLRVEMSDTGPVLVLPLGMREALETYAPRFRPWRLQEYLVDHVEIAPLARSRSLPLFGAAGDFNGDGVRDVALRGRDHESEFFFVILSVEGTGFRIVEIEARKPLSSRPQGIYLRPIAPGQVQVPEGIEVFSGPPPRLTTDAFEWIHVEGGGILYYWKEGRFERYITGD